MRAAEGYCALFGTAPTPETLAAAVRLHAAIEGLIQLTAPRKK